MSSMWDNLSRTERAKLLKKAGLPTGLAQLKWVGLQKSERKKLEKHDKERFEDKKPHFDKNIREVVWREYIGKMMEGYCYCCEIRKITFTDFEVGHNIPISKGGTDEISNLRPVCKQCNNGMRTMVLEEYKRKYFGKKSGKK